MKAHNLAGLLCLSAILFSCSKESDSLIKTNDLKTANVSIQQLGFVQGFGATSVEGVNAFGYFSGDFNGDGYSDIIQPWDNNGKLAVIVHDISGVNNTFKLNDQRDVNGAGSVNVGYAVGDVNGDGKADLVQCWNRSGKMSISLFLSNGTSFVRQDDQFFGQGSVSLGILAVDVDGDGRTDIAQLWNDGGRMAVIIYHSEGNWFSDWGSTKQVDGVNNIGVVPADFDGDGKTDLIQNWDDNGRLHTIVYTSNGRGYSKKADYASPQGSGTTGFVPFDYDSDGKADLGQTWNNGGRANIIVYHSDGSNYSLLDNFGLPQGTSNIKWLSVKRPNEKDGIVQVWNNGGRSSFFRYDPVIF